jgi:carboxymethylenebutenolidase
MERMISTSMITETVSIPVESGELSGAYARPDGEGPFPAVVVIHEIFGLNDNIRDITQHFADEGYAALAVDLFYGRNRAVCMARFMGGLFINTLNHRGIRDLKSSLTYVENLPEVDAERVGAIGFCLGGSFAIAWACTDERLKAIAPFYSMNPRPLEAVARSCPVVGSFPEKDYTAGGGRKLKEALDTCDVPNDIKTYPGAKHSFFNNQGGNYDAAASEDAWQRTLAFFGERIG